MTIDESNAMGDARLAICRIATLLGILSDASDDGRTSDALDLIQSYARDEALKLAPFTE